MLVVLVCSQCYNIASANREQEFKILYQDDFEIKGQANVGFNNTRGLVDDMGFQSYQVWLDFPEQGVPINVKYKAKSPDGAQTGVVVLFYDGAVDTKRRATPFFNRNLGTGYEELTASFITPTDMKFTRMLIILYRSNREGTLFIDDLKIERKQPTPILFEDDFELKGTPRAGVNGTRGLVNDAEFQVYQVWLDFSKQNVPINVGYRAKSPDGAQTGIVILFYDGNEDTDYKLTPIFNYSLGENYQDISASFLTPAEVKFTRMLVVFYRSNKQGTIFMDDVVIQKMMPKPPQNLSASRDSISGKVTLSWNEAEIWVPPLEMRPVKYHIYRYSDPQLISKRNLWGIVFAEKGKRLYTWSGTNNSEGESEAEKQNDFFYSIVSVDDKGIEGPHSERVKVGATVISAPANKKVASYETEITISQFASVIIGESFEAYKSDVQGESLENSFKLEKKSNNEIVITEEKASHGSRSLLMKADSSSPILKATWTFSELALDKPIYLSFDVLPEACDAFIIRFGDGEKGGPTLQINKFFAINASFPGGKNQRISMYDPKKWYRITIIINNFFDKTYDITIKTLNGVDEVVKRDNIPFRFEDITKLNTLIFNNYSKGQGTQYLDNVVLISSFQ